MAYIIFFSRQRTWAPTADSVNFLECPFIHNREITLRFAANARASSIHRAITVHAESLALRMAIRLIFAYNRLMSFGFPILERKQFVVSYKRCRCDVPAGLREFPFQSIVVNCPSAPFLLYLISVELCFQISPESLSPERDWVNAMFFVFN